MGVLAETAIAVLGLFTGGLRQPPNLEEMLLIMTGKQTKGARGRRERRGGAGARDVHGAVRRRWAELARFHFSSSYCTNVGTLRSCRGQGSRHSTPALPPHVLSLLGLWFVRRPAPLDISSRHMRPARPFFPFFPLPFSLPPPPLPPVPSARRFAGLSLNASPLSSCTV